VWAKLSTLLNGERGWVVREMPSVSSDTIPRDEAEVVGHKLARKRGVELLFRGKREATPVAAAQRLVCPHVRGLMQSQREEPHADAVYTLQ
jgi:hypothetical protein